MNHKKERGPADSFKDLSQSVLYLSADQIDLYQYSYITIPVSLFPLKYLVSIFLFLYFYLDILISKSQYQYSCLDSTVS